MYDADGTIRPAYDSYCGWYNEQDPAWLRRQNDEADRCFRRTG